MYSNTEFVASPSGVSFGVWGRDSGVHFDLSVVCESASDVSTPDGVKYHGHNEHPANEAECESRLAVICAKIQAGESLV